MVVRKTLAVAACATAVIGWGVACSHPTRSANAPLAASTRADTLAAMHGEAFAHAKYLAYAPQAQQSGHTRAAQAFGDAAETELNDHFAREADLIGFGGDNAANLRESISGETGEATGMYPRLAAQATIRGDSRAARLFTEIAGDEAAHARDFTAALAAVTTGGVPVPAGPTVHPVSITAGPAAVSPDTVTDLRTAMTGEAFANATYGRYAEQARRSDNPAVADLFARTADVELREHFAAEATLAGLVSTDTKANLTDAIDGEQHEADSMYPDYARRADEAGNPQAASLFREIATDEKHHQQEFTAAMTTA